MKRLGRFAIPILLLVAFIGLPDTAYAAGGPDIDLAKNLKSILGTFKSAIDAKIPLLHDEGRWLTLSLGTIAVAWLGISSALRQKPFNEVIAEAVVVVFSIGMAMWFATNTDARQGIADGFEKVATKIVATAIPGVTASNAVEEATAALTVTIMRMAEAPMGTKVDPQEDGFAGKLVGEAMNGLVMMLYQFVLAVLLGFVALVYIVAAVMSQVMVGIALIIGPILIPFYLIQPLSFVATGWLQFFVGACMAKVGGALMLALTMGFIQKITTDFLSAEAGTAIPFTQFMYAFLLIGVMAYMMMQVWNIGSTIASGPARLGMAMPSSISAGRAANAGGKGASFAASGGGYSAGSSVAGAAGGAIAGARTGAAGGKGIAGKIGGALSGAARGGATGARAAWQRANNEGQYTAAAGGIRDAMKATTKS